MFISWESNHYLGIVFIKNNIHCIQAIHCIIMCRSCFYMLCICHVYSKHSRYLIIHTFCRTTFMTLMILPQYSTSYRNFFSFTEFPLLAPELWFNIMFGERKSVWQKLYPKWHTLHPSYAFLCADLVFTFTHWQTLLIKEFKVFYESCMHFLEN